MSDVILFLGSIVVDIFLLFLSVYYVVTLSDLECDYINAMACCSKLNKFVIPEMVVRAVPTVFFLFTGHWVLLLLNLPFDCWYAYKYVKRPKSHVHYFDPAEIHNRGELKAHMQNSMIRLGEHLVFFFIYLYCFIMALVS